MVLPPQPPVRLSLEFLPELGIGFLIGQGQEMMMIPARAEYIAAEVGFLSSPEIAEIAADAPDCDWSKLPVIVGTNIYELKQASNESQFKKNFSKVDLDPSTMILVCDGFFDSLPPGVVEWIDIQDPPPGAGPALAFCPGQPSKAAKGEMSMTLFLRFSDTDSGSGELIFEGNLNSAHFAARAPITLSR
ncbi:MAG: hypothetical protein GY952_03190 [Rhodobacteraceae bacterium]|nr:hypothetical protein [Paracoccaceae bacterium]